MEQHDESYRALFSFPQMVQDLLTGFVHQDWISELEFDQMEKINASFVSDKLRKRESDVIWRIQWRDRSLYVYILIEMQSSPAAHMAVRLLSYVSLLYQDLIAQKQLTDDGLLPPVFPITLYNGNTPWHAATTMAELLAPVPEALRRYQPQFEYFLLDEAQLAPATEQISSNLVSSLIKVENSASAAKLEQAVEQLAHTLNQDLQGSNTQLSANAQALRKAFTTWLLKSLLPARFPGIELPALNNLSEVKNMLAERVMEWTEQWKQDGIEVGIEQGLEQGVKQTAINMLKANTSVDFISRMTGLAVEDIEALRTQ